MKRPLPFLFIFFTCFYTASGQKLSGQWKGEFTDQSSQFSGLGGDKCSYVLDLTVNHDRVTGFSYTYFDDEGRHYYTICKLEGKADLKKKSVVVTETERIKTNVPSSIRNCFQVHTLVYQKQGDREFMEGSWRPASNQGSGCGFGVTSLNRRNLTGDYAGYTITSKKSAPVKMTASQSNAVKKPNPKTSTASRATTPMQQETESAMADLNATRMPAEKSETRNCQTPSRIHTLLSPQTGSLQKGYKPRNHSLLRTIEVKHQTIRIDLYDNGEIDGDSISVFFKGDLVLTRKKLTSQPICLNLDVDDNGLPHELVMYAENLGAIAPNTALMVVTDGDKRHEVRISSDLEKSGMVNFVRKDH